MSVIRELTVSRSNLVALYKQLEDDGYMFCSDDGHVDPTDYRECWATGYAVDHVDDESMVDHVNRQREALGLPVLESHLIGTYTRWTSDSPEDCVWIKLLDD